MSTKILIALLFVIAAITGYNYFFPPLGHSSKRHKRESEIRVEK